MYGEPAHACTTIYFLYYEENLQYVYSDSWRQMIMYSFVRWNRKAVLKAVSQTVSQLVSRCLLPSSLSGSPETLPQRWQPH